MSASDSLRRRLRWQFRDGRSRRASDVRCLVAIIPLLITMMMMRMVMARGIMLTGAGVGIGAVLAWSATRGMDALLYGVGSTDPLTLALVVGLLAAVSVVACAIPAVRAARVDPMLVLRDQ